MGVVVVVADDAECPLGGVTNFTDKESRLDEKGEFLKRGEVDSTFIVLPGVALKGAGEALIEHGEANADIGEFVTAMTFVEDPIDTSSGDGAEEDLAVTGVAVRFDETAPFLKTDDSGVPKDGVKGTLKAKSVVGVECSGPLSGMTE